MLQQLSAEPIAQALQSKWPWARLKQIATEKGARLVLPEELSKHIETRKQAGPGRKQSKKTRAPEPITTLPLHLFELPGQHFVDPSKAPRYGMKPQE